MTQNSLLEEMRPDKSFTTQVKLLASECASYKIAQCRISSWFLKDQSLQQKNWGLLFQVFVDQDLNQAHLELGLFINKKILSSQSKSSISKCEKHIKISCMGEKGNKTLSCFSNDEIIIVVFFSNLCSNAQVLPMAGFQQSFWPFVFSINWHLSTFYA